MIQKALVTAYFHIPIIVLYWQDLGLSMFEIMLLQAAFSIAAVTLELPSGIFSDMYGRKRSLIIASFFSVVGISLYCVANSFFSLLVAEMFLAGFIAMQSGADSAFLYDNLKALKRERLSIHNC
jgi:MFS family permease